MSDVFALLIGYGNPGRGDDGLGPAFAQRIADRGLPGLAVDIDFQLTADHALTLSDYSLVIFADADLACAPPFSFQDVTGSKSETLGSHSVTPQGALGLARLLFDATPEAHVLGIPGASFGKIEEGLSHTALHNLDAAEAFFVRWYLERSKHLLDARTLDRTLPAS